VSHQTFVDRKQSLISVYFTRPLNSITILYISLLLFIAARLTKFEINPICL